MCVVVVRFTLTLPQGHVYTHEYSFQFADVVVEKPALPLIRDMHASMIPNY